MRHARRWLCRRSGATEPPGGGSSTACEAVVTSASPGLVVDILKHRAQRGKGKPFTGAPVMCINQGNRLLIIGTVSLRFIHGSELTARSQGSERLPKLPPKKAGKSTTSSRLIANVTPVCFWPVCLCHVLARQTHPRRFLSLLLLHNLCAAY